MSDRSIPQLALEVVDAGLELVRTEVAIVREDVRRTVAARAAGVGLLAGAGVIGLLALVFLVLALFYALDATLSSAVAALLTALIVLVVAGVLASVGVRRLRGGPNA